MALIDGFLGSNTRAEREKDLAEEADEDGSTDLLAAAAWRMLREAAHELGIIFERRILRCNGKEEQVA